MKCRQTENYVFVADEDPRIAGPSAGDLLRDLVQRLERMGYREYYASFNPLCFTTPGRTSCLTYAPSQLRPLLELFLLGGSVARNDVEDTLPDIEALIELGILNSIGEGRIRTSGLILVPMFGLWIFCQSYLAANQTLYFGDDSIGLLCRLAPRPRGRALDLCTGPGTQALFASLFADEVVAVDVNPIATTLAELNVALNGRSDKVQVRCGDLYDAVGTAQFDSISANPPLLPFPDSIAYPFVGHGGSDGLRVTRRILEGLPRHLSADGTAQLIGCCLTDGVEPLPKAELDVWANKNAMRVLMTITSEYSLAPGSHFFEGLVTTASNACSTPRNEIASLFEEDLRRQGATSICAYFLHVSRHNPGFILQDLYRGGPQFLWYAD